MTQEQIIEMAQECGLIGMRPHLDGIYSEALVAFAKLIAQRTWIGLTQKEQLNVFLQLIVKLRSEYEIYKAYEMALKDKNT